MVFPCHQPNWRKSENEQPSGLKKRKKKSRANTRVHWRRIQTAPREFSRSVCIVTQPSSVAISVLEVAARHWRRATFFVRCGWSLFRPDRVVGAETRVLTSLHCLHD